jgi:hypothetical protein
MIFILFFSFFPFIHGDCLEFTNNQTLNKCHIKHIVNQNFDIQRYYPQCLQCNIQTLIKSENITLENDNQCLNIDLQCIQLIFNHQNIFEDFFKLHQQYIYDLFYQNNGTDQNTLHVIIKNHTLEEINEEYIEDIFRKEFQAYRVLFIELFISNQNIKLNRNLANLVRLSIKIILNCGQRIQTIYLIHNRNITLESKEDLCSIIPSSTSTSDEVLSISEEKSRDLILLIILLTSSLVCLLITFIICCVRYLKRRHRRRKSLKEIETPSELSLDEDIETPKPQVVIKSKPPVRGMRAIQFLEDDI